MATEVKRRRGTSTEHDSFTGAPAEITVDTTKDTAVVHNGSTVGGFPLLRQDFNNINLGAGLLATTDSLDYDEDLQPKITTIASELSGTVTEIDIVSVDDTIIDVGDDFYVYNTSTAQFQEFTLASEMLPESTTIEVETVDISPATIPVGSWIFYTASALATIISRSQQAIRLGVIDTDYLNDSTGDTITNEDGDIILNGSQDAGSYLTLLEDEIVAKVTRGGLLASVRLGVDIDEGEESVIELKADNIDLIGLVTAINADNGTETEIDGGKIKADTSITVGSGDEVIVLSGDDELYRIWAGNAIGASAPFSVDKDGNVRATSVTTLSGDGTGTVENLKLTNLEVSGTVTVTDGEVKATDEVTFTATDYDIETTLKDGLLTFDISESAVSKGDITLGVVSQEIPELQLNTSTNRFTRVQPSVISLDRNAGAGGASSVQVTTSSSADSRFLTLGSNYEMAPSVTAESNYLKVNVDGTDKYLRLYS